jgi:iron complex outermembrane receptor protein
MCTARIRNAVTALPFTLLISSLALGQTAPDGATATAQEKKTATNLPEVQVCGPQSISLDPAFPATLATIQADKIEATINAVDVEDAAKYLPSIFIRKRNYGDTQPVLATRTWGLGSSARTLVYVDDIPISALIANNNTIGAPRWGVVSPEAVDHIDMLYGPFSAAYAGNSMGGVMQIVTRAPEKTEVTIKQTLAVQSFNLYGTKSDYSTSQTSVTAGGRSGDLSWFLGANTQNSFSQPLTFITAGSTPAGTSGTIPAKNKLGQTANVLGAGGLLHTRMLNLNGKFSYDLTPTLRLSYLAGYWSNDGQSQAQTYLTGADGQPTFGKAAGFASNTYQLIEHHLMQALSLKSDTRGDWDGEVVVTHYAYLKDQQLSPAGVIAGTGFTENGRLADFGGTGWSTLDLKGIWRPQGFGGAHEVAFGAHADEYTLDNPTRNTASWTDPSTAGSLFTAGRGKTRTDALWVQDAWVFAPDWLATIGGRFESWKASEGFNFSGNTAVNQPTESANAFSPKATLRWDVAKGWAITGSLAKAVRFPTVGELYQLVSTGSTFSTPNPNLRPEKVLSGELAIEHTLDDGSMRLSLFQENARQALISQTSTLDGYPVPVTFVMNVGEVRNRGVEWAAQKNNVLVQGLELSGSVTFVDSTILSNDSFVSTTGSTSQGKHAPNVPRWRATVVATWHATTDLAFTLAGRYSGKQYSTLDNSDNTANVFGAFDSFKVFDARVHYQATEQLALSLGVDNFTNQKYFLFHPFPQRTYVADMKLSF